MKFKSLKGCVSENSSFIQIEIEDGNNDNCIGDQVWINKEGTLMEVYESADKDVLKEVEELFEGGSRFSQHRTAFRGALRRMGVEY